MKRSEASPVQKQKNIADLVLVQTETLWNFSYKDWKYKYLLCLQFYFSILSFWVYIISESPKNPANAMDSPGRSIILGMLAKSVAKINAQFPENAGKEDNKKKIIKKCEMYRK